MDFFNSVDEILDFAIAGEQEAYKFYMNLAEKMANPNMSETFRSFAREERGHKERLEGIKKGDIQPAMKFVEAPNLAIADYVVAEAPSADMDYQQSLILAMKHEKAAFKLYSDLASKAKDEDLRNLFGMLAQEEAKHKLRFEIEYDDEILREN